MLNIEQNNSNIDTSIDYSSTKPEIQEAFKNLGIHTDSGLESIINLQEEVTNGKLQEMQAICDRCSELPTDPIALFFQENIQPI